MTFYPYLYISARYTYREKIILYFTFCVCLYIAVFGLRIVLLGYCVVFVQGLTKADQMTTASSKLYYTYTSIIYQTITYIDSSLYVTLAQSESHYDWYFLNISSLATNLERCPVTGAGRVGSHLLYCITLKVTVGWNLFTWSSSCWFTRFHEVYTKERRYVVFQVPASLRGPSSTRMYSYHARLNSSMSPWVFPRSLATRVFHTVTLGMDVSGILQTCPIHLHRRRLTSREMGCMTVASWSSVSKIMFG